MSGLENFNTTESWRNRLKKLILMERKPIPQPVAIVKEPQRFNLDLDKKLQNIVEEKSITIARQESPSKMSYARSGSSSGSGSRKEENKENHFVNIHGVKSRMICKVDETLMLEERDMSQWLHTSDESFEVIEKMCNKTASDPDSTLFAYLNSEHQEQVLANAKKRHSEGSTGEAHNKRGYGVEELALKRLLDGLRMEDQKQLENESPLKGVDVTQLEDIEAPSRLWENTITGDTILQTSPVKMVGLLRPSTIIEEYGEEATSCCSETSSNRLSFQSALKSRECTLAASSEPTSSCYETAQNSTNSSCVTNTEYNLVEAEEARKIAAEIDIFTVNVENLTEETVSAENLIDLEQTTNLIDLEQTLFPLQNVSQASPAAANSELELSIIEILSDDEEKSENLSTPLTTTGNVKLEKISLSAADAHNCKINNSAKNCSYDGDQSGTDNSMVFDNTMEEVDYMLQKGLKYMAAKNMQIGPTSTTTITHDAHSAPPKPEATIKQNTFLLSPNKSVINSPTKRTFNSPTKRTFDSPRKQMYNSPKIGGTPTKTVASVSPRSKPISHYALNIKPIPKLDIFKKPSGIPTSSSMRYKEHQQKHFSHIVSPIGAYMKKTGTTPLMATIKTRTNHADVHNSTAFRELEHESRLYAPKFDIKDDVGADSATKLVGVPNIARTLPEKAYISSEFKHIVDERTPVTIPGGKKIQKYLETAMLPAVVRHEGKLKLPNCNSPQKLRPKITTQENTATAGVPTSRQSDFGNLSVMSGDVSVYTIMDAQKF